MSGISFVGLGISPAVADDPVRAAQVAEQLGFDFVSISDHPAGGATYETLTLLTWIAAATSRIRVASRVLGVPFRRPAMVAKAAESLQRLSHGRLILGLGGGYSDDEIAAVGAPIPSAREKVDGLADAVRIMRAAWTGESVDYPGAVHSVTGLRLTPPPVDPIPVWLGTYGPRALAVTGQLADGWIPSLAFAPPERIPAMLARIRESATAAGRSPDSVRAIYSVPVRLGRAERQDAVAGTASDVIEQLSGFSALGFTGLNLQPAADTDVRRLAEEVVPGVRA